MPKGNGIPTEKAIPMLADALAYYDETDVQRWFERQQRITGHYPTVWPSTIEDVKTFKRVPNEPFRQPWLEVRRPQEGEEVTNGRRQGIEPIWASLFREELTRVINLPEALDSPPTKIGPGDLSYSSIVDYLRSALGIRNHGSTLAWLVQYEVAEALCKTLGLIPYTVGI